MSITNGNKDLPKVMVIFAIIVIVGNLPVKLYLMDSWRDAIIVTVCVLAFMMVFLVVMNRFLPLTFNHRNKKDDEDDGGHN